MFEATGCNDAADPARPRLADPELRSRVVGYLAGAPLARVGCRTDGVWTWPESLAARLRAHGVGPQPELLDHLATREFLLADQSGLDSASGAVEPAPAARLRSVRYYAAIPGAVTVVDLLRLSAEPDGESGAGAAWLAPTGWVDDDGSMRYRPAGGRPDPGAPPVDERFHEVPSHRAAELADRLCRSWYDDLLDAGRETEEAGDRPRVARVYDGESPDGRPWFSPSRLRVVEPARRERLFRYLMAGRTVLRATGRMPDPLAAGCEPVVPLSFRTDGEWVWSEALAYYVSARGIAPELDLLRHIEERAYLHGQRPSDDLARRAAHLATRPPQAHPRIAPKYFATASGDLMRQRGEPARPEWLADDLRWRRLPMGWPRPRTDLVEVTEADVVAELDARWGRLAGVRPDPA